VFEFSTPLFVISYLLIFLGFVGALVPVLPGPLLIWLGALVWAWADGFVHLGWPTLLVLALLTIIAWGADLGLSVVSSRRSGAGWRSIGVSILGGLAGALLLFGIPFVGPFIGAAGGSLGALWLMEYRRAQHSSNTEERSQSNGVTMPDRREAAPPATAIGRPVESTAQDSRSDAPSSGAHMQAVRPAQARRAAATRAVRGYVGGFLLAMAVEFIISVTMLAIFAWQAFL
jgi:uncharacterized protein YqgC (DUF456 family)